MMVFLGDARNASVFAAIESFVVCAAALFFLLRSGLAARALDQPNARSLHTQPIPRVGGLGILLAVLVSAATLGDFGVRCLLLLPLLAVSLVDDLRGLGIAPRIATHLAAAAGAMLAVGVPPWLSLGGFLGGVVLIVWGTNLYNFMDGSDGLAGGMTVFGFSFLGLAALRGGDSGLAAWCFSFAAAALAFLRFNYSPARIFMGDSGSAPIGYAAASCAIEGCAKGLWPWWYPLFVFSPFVLDATVTLLRRMLRGERFWQAHREHYYQRLTRLGWGHRRTATAYYSLMLAAGLAAWLALGQSASEPWFVGGIVAVVAASLMIAVDRAWLAKRNSGHDV
jgi:UDP-N-acetylmuramyl pentapeptide phosphotransferase/UDP-N-acetylglucosamine-1-phosphate transferase